MSGHYGFIDFRVPAALDDAGRAKAKAMAAEAQAAIAAGAKVRRITADECSAIAIEAARKDSAMRSKRATRASRVAHAAGSRKGSRAR